jgi:hypothetical protein
MNTLEQLIAEKLRDGRLPDDGLPRVWRGPSKGHTCHACDGAIATNHVSIEGIGETGCDIQLHVDCFYIWRTVQHVPAS